MVDDDLRPLKSGQTCVSVSVCANDTASSNPTTPGRGAADDHAHTTNNCFVSSCGSVRCKTCKHICQGNTFVSNITRRNYSVVSYDSTMNCATENVVYLIACRKCGVQYVGETSQKLHSRFNNHRNRLKSMANLYLYQHFSSDGHTEDDMCIMPIEKVEDLGSRSAATSKRLEREDYWCRELCTYYPYGLNDNIRGVGNISKMKNELVVNTLFNKNKRKLRIRKNRRQRKKRDLGALTDCIEQYLENYKTCSFCFNVRILVLSLPKKCMYMVWNIFQNWVATHEVPTRIRVLFRDLIAFRKNASHGIALDVGVSRKGREHSGFLKVHYHNKGIEMIGLPQILNSRYVRSAIPPFLNNKEPPMVSYSYTRTISGRIFNQKSVVEELDLTRGTEGMCCDCSNSSYCYERAGHVMTGDLTIIWDAKLRSLVRKGPSYREQNYGISMRDCVGKL